MFGPRLMVAAPVDPPSVAATEGLVREKAPFRQPKPRIYAEGKKIAWKDAMRGLRCFVRYTLFT